MCVFKRTTIHLLLKGYEEALVDRDVGRWGPEWRTRLTEWRDTNEYRKVSMRLHSRGQEVYRSSNGNFAFSAL
jgi:hypothetical protein